MRDINGDVMFEISCGNKRNYRIAYYMLQKEITKMAFEFESKSKELRNLLNHVNNELSKTADNKIPKKP